MLDKHFIEAYAKNIENEINNSIRMSLEGVCKTIRGFAYDIIDREAPELDEKKRQILLDAWIPNLNNSPATLVKNGFVNGIPPSMMFEMTLQFVKYGIGAMPQEEVKVLEKTLGTSWTKRYWDCFPHQIKILIRDFIKNSISVEMFSEKLKAFLELVHE